jgi:hypothetical protein
MVHAMADDVPTVELRRRQQEQERAELECLAEAEDGPEAERHRRRAEKAGYLRDKLEQAEQAEREAARAQA